MSQSTYIGYLLSAGYMIVMFLNKYIVSKITGVPTYVLLSARFAISFMILFPIFLRPKSNEIMVTSNLKLQILRAITIACVVFFTFAGYQNLPLSIASAISASEPIFVGIWGIVLGYETKKTFPLSLSIIILGLIGMFLVTGINLNMPTLFEPAQYIGIGSLLLANIFCSASHYLSSILGRTDGSQTTLTYNILFISAGMLLCNTLLGATGNGFNFNLLHGYTWQILALGTCAAAGSWFGISALRNIDPNTHVSVQNLSLPFALLVSYFVEGETIPVLKLIGMGGILLCAILSGYRRLNFKDLSSDKSSKRGQFITMIIGSYLALASALGLYYFLNARDSGSKVVAQQVQHPAGEVRKIAHTHKNHDHSGHNCEHC